MTPAQSADVRRKIVVEADGHWAEIRYEPFDSELLGVRIGRTVTPAAPQRRQLEALLQHLSAQAQAAEFDQLLSRVRASSFNEIWALESAGYLLMDVGVTFARRVDGPLQATAR